MGIAGKGHRPAAGGAGPWDRVEPVPPVNCRPPRRSPRRDSTRPSGLGTSPRPTRPLDIPELAEVLAATIAFVGIHRPVVVGHSIGAQVAVEVAVRRPGEVRGLVLAGATEDPALGTALGLWGRCSPPLGGSP
ncbi:MAG: alpha/beta fold hydrolase [Acidimicrobiales bacterium]